MAFTFWVRALCTRQHRAWGAMRRCSSLRAVRVVRAVSPPRRRPCRVQAPGGDRPSSRCPTARRCCWSRSAQSCLAPRSRHRLAHPTAVRLKLVVSTLWVVMLPLDRLGVLVARTDAAHELSVFAHVSSADRLTVWLELFLIPNLPAQARCARHRPDAADGRLRARPHGPRRWVPPRFPRCCWGRIQPARCRAWPGC